MAIGDSDVLPVLGASWSHQTALQFKTYVGVGSAGPPGSAGVATFAGMPSISMPSGTNICWTTGYTTDGDGGHGTYARVTSAPTGAAIPGSFRTSDRYLPNGSTDNTNGGYWIYLPDGRGCNALCFGAIADGAGDYSSASFTGTDNRAAVQAAIDFGLYYANRKIYVPGGKYKLAAGLQFGYGDSFKSGIFEGDGPGFVADGATIGTSFLCNFTTTNGINVQGARNDLIQDMAFIGLNGHWIVTNGLMGSTPGVDDVVQANWIDPSLTSGNANINSRTAPYCGVSIDAYAGAQPTAHYPSYSYPAWTGIGAQYNKTLSSNVLFRRVFIAGFVKARGIQPNADGNGDFIRFEDCYTQCNVVAVSAGNSQGRLVSDINGENSLFHTAFETGVIGAQIGSLSFTSLNTNYDQCIRLLGVADSARAGACQFIGGYAELIWSIGVFPSGNSSTNAPITFKSFNFSFGAQTLTRGLPKQLFQATGPGMARFEGCVFTGHYSVAPFLAEPGCLSFENCVIEPAGTPFGSAYQWFPVSATAGGFLFPLQGSTLRPERFKVLATTYAVDSGAVAQYLPGEACLSSRGRPACLWSPYISPSGNPAVRTPNIVYPHVLAKSNLTSIALSGTTLTIDTTAQGWLEGTNAALLNGAVPGSLLYDTDQSLYFFVRSLSSNILLAELQNGYRQWPGASTLNGAINSAVTGIVVTANASFAQSNYQGGMVVQIDNERMLVTAGYGTNSWTVTRGYDGTSAASHSNAAAVTGATVLFNSFSPSTDNIGFVSCAVFTPTDITYGTFTSGSAIVSAVGDAIGTVGALGAQVLANDLLYVDPTQVVFAPYSYTAVKISSVGTSPGSLTLGGNSRYTAVGQGPLLFVHQPPANV